MKRRSFPKSLSLGCGLVAFVFFAYGATCVNGFNQDMQISRESTSMFAAVEKMTAQEARIHLVRAGWKVIQDERDHEYRWIVAEHPRHANYVFDHSVTTMNLRWYASGKFDNGYYMPRFQRLYPNLGYL